MRLILLFSLALTFAACGSGTEPPTVYGTYLAQWSSLEPAGTGLVYEYGYTLEVRLDVVSGRIEAIPGGAGSMEVVRNRNAGGTVTERSFYEADVESISGTYNPDTRAVWFEAHGASGDPVELVFRGRSDHTYGELEGEATGEIGMGGIVEFDDLITFRRR